MRFESEIVIKIKGEADTTKEAKEYIKDMINNNSLSYSVLGGHCSFKTLKPKVINFNEIK